MSTDKNDMKDQFNSLLNELENTIEVVRNKAVEVGGESLEKLKETLIDLEPKMEEAKTWLKDVGNTLDNAFKKTKK